MWSERWQSVFVFNRCTLVRVITMLLVAWDEDFPILRSVTLLDAKDHNEI